MQKNPAPALVLWIIAAQVFMGIVAYEWLPASYRGSWIFLLMLLISGAFLNIGSALQVGLIAFISMTVYFSLDLANQTYKLTKTTKHAKRHFWLTDVCTCHGLLPSHSA